MTERVFVNKGKLFAITENGLYTSTNNGTSWKTTFTNAPSGSLYNFAAIDSNVFLTTSNGLYRSADNGDAWTKIDSTGSGYIVCASGSTLFTDKGSDVYRSTDLGLTWTATTLTNQSITEIGAHNGRLYVGCQDANLVSRIYTSTDNGNTWTSTILSGGSPFHDFAFKGSVVFSANEEGFFRSTNNGSTWTEYNVGIFNSKMFALAVQGNSLYVGFYNGVYVSNNDGTSWTNVSPPYTAIEDLAVNGGTLFAATAFNGVWKTSISTGIDEAADNLSGFVYPNPVYNELNINIGSAVIESISIYNINGALVYESLQPELKHIDVSGFDSGIYTITAKTINGVQRSKWIKR